MRIAGMLDAVALEGAEIISIPEFGAQLFKDGPVALLALSADLAFEMAHQLSDDAIVVKQSVINIEEEDYFTRRHRESAPP
jgi:hypothetical protein